MVHAANLGWRGVDVAEGLGADLGVPLSVEHDVYLAALAEWETGNGVGADSMLYASVGTGVATRLFNEGASNRGSAHLAGEMGFVPVGQQGRSLESVASAAVCLDDPGIVVIGGGVSNAGSVLLAALESRLASLLEPLRTPPPLVLAAHGDQSGIIGAALHGGRRGAHLW